MTICAICGTDVGRDPHAFLCRKHAGLIPRKEAQAYASAARAWDLARRTGARPPSRAYDTYCEAYVSAKNAALDAHANGSPAQKELTL